MMDTASLTAKKLLWMSGLLQIPFLKQTQTRGEDNLQFLQQERPRQFHLPPLTTEIQPEPAWHAKEQLVVVPAGVAIGEPTVQTDC